MKITPKLEFVTGSFDTENCELVCVSKWKYRTVELCVKSENGWNVPIGEIKLYDDDLFVSADWTFEDAKLFCEEIVRRFNECKDKR